MTYERLRIEHYQGMPVAFRVKDRYANATALCQANGKFFNNYYENKTTKEFLAALSRSTGIPVDVLVQIRMDGPNIERGTWVHPKVAYNLAQWCNAECAVWVVNVLDHLHEHGSVWIAPPENAAEVFDDEMDMDLPLLFQKLQGEIEQGNTNTNIRFDQLEIRMEEQFVTIQGDVKNVETNLSEHFKSAQGKRRKEIPSPICRIHVRFVTQKRNRICPCCLKVEVITPEGEVTGHFDHFYKPSDARLEKTWLICAECNQRREHDPVFSEKSQKAFDFYQSQLIDFLKEEKDNQQELF